MMHYNWGGCHVNALINYAGSYAELLCPTARMNKIILLHERFQRLYLPLNTIAMKINQSQTHIPKENTNHVKSSYRVNE